MPVLVADIGGTSARFAVAQLTPWPWLERTVVVPTAAAPHLAGLLGLAQEKGLGLEPQHADAVVLAVAGAVREGKAWLPNAGLVVDVQDPCLGGQAVVVNDFVAQAYATLHPEVMASGRILQAGSPHPGPRAVAGAGTGFGASVLVPCKKGWTPLAMELGHAPYPFTPEERPLQDLVLAEAGGAILDAVVSGPGLARVHHWQTGEILEPAAVAAKLSPGHPTVHTFAQLYGRALRFLALATLPSEGIFVAGGVAARNPWFFEEAIFLEEFRRCRGYEAFLAAIPLYLVTHPAAGLLGAAMVALEGESPRRPKASSASREHPTPSSCGE